MSIEKFNGKFSSEANGVTVLINSVVQSIKDFSVLGIYTYLASKPDTWEPNAKELMKHTGYSKDKIYRLINALLAEGLMTVKTVREQGRFLHFSYTIHLHKQPVPENKEMACTPFPEKQDPAQPVPENKEAYKTKNTSLERKELKNISIPKSLSYSVGPFDAYQKTISEQLSTQSTQLTYGLTNEELNTFEEFWKIYPSKKNKQRAKELWFAQECQLITHILCKLREQIKNDKHFIDGFHPSACNYISGKRWEDEIELKSKRSHFDNTSISWADGIEKDLF